MRMRKRVATSLWIMGLLAAAFMINYVLFAVQKPHTDFYYRVWRTGRAMLRGGESLCSSIRSEISPLDDYPEPALCLPAIAGGSSCVELTQRVCGRRFAGTPRKEHGLAPPSSRIRGCGTSDPDLSALAGNDSAGAARLHHSVCRLPHGLRLGNGPIPPRRVRPGHGPESEVGGGEDREEDVRFWHLEVNQVEAEDSETTSEEDEPAEPR